VTPPFNATPREAGSPRENLSQFPQQVFHGPDALPNVKQLEEKMKRTDKAVFLLTTFCVIRDLQCLSGKRKQNMFLT